MKRLGRWLALALLLPIVLLVGALLVFQASSQESRREILLAAAGLVPGLELRLGPDFTWEMSSRLEMVVRDFVLEYSHGSREWRLRGQSAELSLPLLPLLKGSLEPDFQGSGIVVDMGGNGRLLSPWPSRLAVKPGKLRLNGLDLRWKRAGRVERLHVDYLARDGGRESWRVELRGRFHDHLLRLHGGPGQAGMLQASGSLGPIRFSLAAPDRGEQGFLTDSRIEVEAPDLCALGSLLEQEPPCLGPLKSRFRIRRQETRVHLESLELVVGPNELRGHLYVDGDPADGGLEIGGKLRSEMLDLGFLFPAKKEGRVRVLKDARETSALKTGAEAERLFSDRPLPLRWMKSLRLDLRLELARLRGGSLAMSDVKVPVVLENGHLRVGEFSGRMGREVLRGKLLLDVSKGVPVYALSLKGRNLDLASALAGLKQTPGKPRLSLEATIEGRGGSLASMAAGATGEVLLELRDYSLGNAYRAGLVERLLRVLNPREEDKANRLQCGALYSVIRDGRASTPRGMAAVFEEVTWLGQGNVDLKTEKLSLVFRPLSRKRLGLRLRGPADLVMLGGSLARPTILVDPKGALRNTLSVAAAVSTSGASLLLEGLLDKSRAEGDVCGQVLGR